MPAIAKSHDPAGHMFTGRRTHRRLTLRCDAEGDLACGNPVQFGDPYRSCVTGTAAFDPMRSHRDLRFAAVAASPVALPWLRILKSTGLLWSLQSWSLLARRAENGGLGHRRSGRVNSEQSDPQASHLAFKQRVFVHQQCGPSSSLCKTYDAQLIALLVVIAKFAHQTDVSQAMCEPSGEEGAGSQAPCQQKGRGFTHEDQLQLTNIRGGKQDLRRRTQGSV